MEHLFAVKYSYLIPLLPLLGAAVAGLLCTGRRKTLAHWPIWITVGASAALSISLLVQMLSLGSGHAETHHGLGYVQEWYRWISAGAFDVPVAFFFDPLTAVMLTVVTGIGFLITVFSAGYMKGEEGYSRFFAYLGLFIFMMTMLVMGNNFLMLYLGWEGVGLCSYLLIGYYYDKPSAREAAKKAFLVNRVGDFGFGLGIMLMFAAFGTVSYFGEGGSGVLQLATGSLSDFQQTAMLWLPFLLMLGAFGKSAQFPLYVWLPDAMEGPTPVSALIHAATMVTAGVYMIVRCGTLFVGNEAAMLTIALIGCFTAIFAASIALRQFDLKKVFAYSTISQLGFMFVAVGVLAPVAGIFHLMTHAFFKALLFLSSGVVMHAMLGELDLRKMSGLKRVLPATRWLLLIGSLALAGFPFVSGFFSKDEIVAAAWHRYPVLGLVLLITAFMTAYYTFRLYFRVFEGPLVLPEMPAGGHAGHAGHDAHSHHDPHAAPDQQGPADIHAHPKVTPAAGDAEVPAAEAHGHDAPAAEVHHHHNHEPLLMIVPLILLALGAAFAGYVNWPGHSFAEFLGKSPSLVLTEKVITTTYGADAVSPLALGQHDTRPANIREKEHNDHIRMMAISGAIAAAGIALAYLLHRQQRELATRLHQKVRGLADVLDAKYWVDEVYQQGIVEPLRSLGRAMFAFDRYVIDLAVWACGFAPQGAGFVLKFTTQRGYLQGYAAAMLLGILIILVVVLF
jgi:NADH-quinone oxidoreductase subunit L